MIFRTTKVKTFLGKKVTFWVGSKKNNLFCSTFASISHLSFFVTNAKDLKFVRTRDEKNFSRYFTGGCLHIRVLRATASYSYIPTVCIHPRRHSNITSSFFFQKRGGGVPLSSKNFFSSSFARLGEGGVPPLFHCQFVLFAIIIQT